MRQDRDVLRPLAQRRDGDGHDLEPVVQIAAEGAGSDLLLEVRVGGGDDAHVHLDRLGPPDAHERAILEHAQDLRLQRQRHLADLVQKERAAVRQLELPRLALHGPREGAALVAEQLALQDVGGDGGAVDRQEAEIPARRVLVDGVGDQLLAGAALPDDQHAAAGGRHERQLVQHLLHAGRRPDDLPEGELLLEPLLEARHLLGQAALLDRDRHALPQLDQVDRLLEVVIGPLLHGVHGRLHRAEPGDHQHGDPRIGRLRLLEDLQAVHARHPQIGHQKVGAVPLQVFDPFLARVERRHQVAVLAQGHLGAAAVSLVIVDDDHLPLGISHATSRRRPRQRPPHRRRPRLRRSRRRPACRAPSEGGTAPRPSP